MAKWMLKAVVQKAISFLPAKERVNFFFQKHVTRGVDLSEVYLGSKLEAARDHMRYYDKFGTVDRREAVALELGTGWYPVVPIMLFLCGFDRVTSIDIRKWTNRERQLATIRRLLAYYDQGRLDDDFPRMVPERIAVLRGIIQAPHSYTEAEINRAVRLETLIMDATDLRFPDGSFDLICSNNTFEHIYPDILRPILREFRRVINKHGVMSHFVDLSDHFAHLDASISIYHFLRFSDRQWRWIDNDIQPQNRLRWSDYLRLYQELDIPLRERQVRPGEPETVREEPLADKYAGYSVEDLAISHGYLVS